MASHILKPKVSYSQMYFKPSSLFFLFILISFLVILAMNIYTLTTEEFQLTNFIGPTFFLLTILWFIHYIFIGKYLKAKNSEYILSDNKIEIKNIKKQKTKIIFYKDIVSIGKPTSHDRSNIHIRYKKSGDSDLEVGTRLYQIENPQTWYEFIEEKISTSNESLKK